MSNTPKQEMPEWFDGKKINEILFCEAFRKEHPMICINGRFFTVDGLISDPGKLESEIFNTIKWTSWYTAFLHRDCSHPSRSDPLKIMNMK